uniref:NADH-ubiquinone oxidoreductase chain 6 n=1 Tax=Pedicia sp. ZK-2016 TaxID=1808012 RepID=A0A191F7Q5_9DIPT|nr:NADH dehydrogenase subunit 6 [Pedicia sp. ZK-2016]
MIQFLIASCSLAMSLMFMQMKHPLAMGIILLIQTFLICLMTGSFAKTFWFSYVLFLVFLGGMLVLFIYVTSLASNEMFMFSMKLFMTMMTIIIMMWIIIMMMDSSIITSMMMNNEMMSNMNMELYITENSINLNKLYNFPTNMITLLLINYLFLTLIIIVKITNNFQGPLRPKN